MKKRILSMLIAILIVMGTVPFTVHAADEVSFEASRTDFRDESVYTLLVTRFYDGDTGNNVMCWDDPMAGNTEDDPAWRGDFKGLIERLDYIKALGFTAIRISPVVQNASSYDYHGEHPIDLMDIDFRLESEGFTYVDLIDACHARGMKIMQNVILNNTSSFGEETLGKFFGLNTAAQWSISESMIPNALLLEKYPNYESMSAGLQLQARIDLLRNYTEGSYHTESNMGYSSSIQQQGTAAADCIDINTENPLVAFYLATTCVWYAEMGVDAICILGTEYINRWTLNEGILPKINSLLEENDLELEIFYELIARACETWNQNMPSISVPFYSWAETEAAWQGNFSDSDTAANIQNSINHFDSHRDIGNVPTSNNAVLNGLSYHTPDYSMANGMHAFDFTMLWNFENARTAYGAAIVSDRYMNDATWNLMSVDSIDYGPDGMDRTRYSLGQSAWQKNLNLLFTFRGIPSILYGTEIEFQKNLPLDLGTTAPLAETGRAYYGDYLEGTLEVTDFGVYTATGKVAETLLSPLAMHIRRLNAIRRSIPALRKGQYTVDGNYVSGDMAYIRRYTNAEEGIDSLALVSFETGATFKNIPNGKYIDAVTGDVKNVTNGTLTVSPRSSGEGGLAVYVCCASGFTGISGKIEGGSGSNGGYRETAPTLTFSANGGSGKMDKQNSGYVLPECTFTAPAGAEFLGWSVNGTLYRPGDEVSISVDSMARAMWSTTGASDSSNSYTVSAIAVNAEGGSVTGAGLYKNGAVATLNAIANTGYVFTGWTENGKLVSIKESYSFLVTKDRSIAARFVYDEQPDYSFTPDGSDTPVGDGSTAFYFQAETAMDQAYFYIWSDASTTMSSWPGEKMIYVGNNLWKCNVPAEANYIIFNNGSGWQTNDLTLPKDGKNLFDHVSQTWSAYGFQIETQDCASIRIFEENSGLRFKTHIKTASLEALIQQYGAQNVTVGTLIAPTDYLTETKLTHALGTDGVDYIDVVANIAAPFAVQGDTRVYAGSIANIREYNLGRDFTGVGYIKIVDGDRVDYIYSEKSCVRNASDVATAAYNDVQDAADIEYQYEVVGEDDVHLGKYSPYTEAQRKILRKFFVTANGSGADERVDE